jgi:hypothetical protein
MPGRRIFKPIHKTAPLRWLTLLFLVLVWLQAAAETAAQDPLPSWNPGTSEQAILDFVTTEELGHKLIDGKAAMIRRPEIAFVNDTAGKPIGIQRHIGRRPARPAVGSRSSG